MCFDLISYLFINSLPSPRHVHHRLGANGTAISKPCTKASYLLSICHVKNSQRFKVLTCHVLSSRGNILGALCDHIS